MTEARFDTISFLSDYGLEDEFVGVVHSVLRTLAPTVTVIDVTHSVPVHDVRAGGLALARSVQYLAPGVVLAVVDPGVGTSRRAIAVEVGGGAAYLVGPDNGLLAPAVAMVGGADRAVELTNPEFRLPGDSKTFDGRDVFAPAAAALCNGVAFEDLGPLIDPSSLWPGMVPLPQPEGDSLAAEVMWVDHFGNAQLNVGAEDIAAFGETVEVNIRNSPRDARRVGTFGELAEKELGLIVDSYGLVALVMNQASASSELNITAADAVSIAAGDTSQIEGGAGVTVNVQIKEKP